MRVDTAFGRDFNEDIFHFTFLRTFASESFSLSFTREKFVYNLTLKCPPFSNISRSKSDNCLMAPIKEPIKPNV